MFQSQVGNTEYFTDFLVLVGLRTGRFQIAGQSTGKVQLGLRTGRLKLVGLGTGKLRCFSLCIRHCLHLDYIKLNITRFVDKE
jgi:hypothetical protein